jgi:hypothetical protein
MRQKLVIWLLAFYTVIVGGLAWTSTPLVAIVFYVLLVVQILAHTFWLCPRCGNYSCAVNPKSPHFIFLGQRTAPPIEPRPGMTMTLPVIMLVLTMVVGLYGIWLISPIVSYALAWVGAVLVYGYTRVACRTCGNICIAAGARGQKRAAEN